MLFSSCDSEMWPAERGAAAADSASDGDSASNDAHISNEVKKNLLYVLRTQPHGVNVNSLNSCYTDKIGSKLDFRRLGFDNLVDMLKTVQEIR